MNVKFYKNQESGEVTLSLLGREAAEGEVELKANSTDAAKEKHVPVVTVEGNTVNVVVGSTIHPMTEAHHIAFICLVTDQKAELKKLDPVGEPKAEFVLAEGEKVVAAYEYCNLHGLWVKEL
jgi:superoxide reductase